LSEPLFSLPSVAQRVQEDAVFVESLGPKSAQLNIVIPQSAMGSWMGVIFRVRTAYRTPTPLKDHRTHGSTRRSTATLS
jgi:hypothetical protein